MKRIVLLLLLPFFAQSQVGVNTTTPNAMLDVSSTNNGFLIPRIALTSAIDAATVVNPQGGALATSTLIYNTATAGASPNGVTPGFYYWNGTRWIGLGATPDWQLNGNAGTNDPAIPATYGTSLIAPGENYVGTSDTQDLVFGVNGRERMRIEHATGDIGIGTANPNHLFTVEDRSYEGTAISGRNINAAGDGTGVEGSSLNGPGFGYGGRFYGGFRGVVAVNQGGSHTLETIGIEVILSGTAGTRIGGRFSASGGANNYSIVTPQNGGLAGFGTITPLHRAHVVEETPGVVSFLSENTSTSNSDGVGIRGRSVNGPGYGYGGTFEGGYRGVAATASGGAYTGTAYAVQGIASGTAGTRVGGYFQATGGTTNLAIQAQGTVRIVDGTQGVNRVFTSDAAGNGSWQLPGANNIVGILGAGVTVPTTQTASYLYTGSRIILPPGRYAVQVVMLIAVQNAPSIFSPNNSSFWMRSTFTDNTTTSVPSPDIVGSQLISGNLGGTSPFGLVTGIIIINNTTAGNKTYYYKAGRVVATNTTTPAYLFGGFWDEDSIIAIRLN